MEKYVDFCKKFMVVLSNHSIKEIRRGIFVEKNRKKKGFTRKIASTVITLVLGFTLVGPNFTSALVISKPPIPYQSFCGDNKAMTSGSMTISQEGTVTNGPITLDPRENCSEVPNPGTPPIPYSEDPIVTNDMSGEDALISQEEPYVVDLITKANPFIYLDTISETYKINEEGLKTLTDAELAEVNNILNKTNADVKQYRSDFVIKDNTFVAKPALELQETQSGSLSTSSYPSPLWTINKNKDFDYCLTWYGLRMYWSHSFVEDVKANLAKVGMGTGGLYLAVLTALNLKKIPVPNWLGTSLAVGGSITVYTYVSKDLGMGIYLDCVMYVPTAWYPVKVAWMQIDNNWYFYDADEKMVKGWVFWDRYWYYLDPKTGIMKTDWLYVNGKWYYANANGALQTGWLKKSTKWYYLHPGSADMHIGWLYYGNKWYYLNNPSGEMSVYQWQWIGGKCYYFYSDGSMAVSTTINGYKVGADGAWIP